MKSIPLNEETARIAESLIWFESAEEALSYPVVFMAYAMAYATHEEMTKLRHYVSDADLRYALDHAPPGIIDARSWAYWNTIMGRYPVPPMPVRNFGDFAGPLDIPFGRGQEDINRVAEPTYQSSKDVRAMGREDCLRKGAEAGNTDLEKIRREAREQLQSRNVKDKLR